MRPRRLCAVLQARYRPPPFCTLVLVYRSAEQPCQRRQERAVVISLIHLVLLMAFALPPFAPPFSRPPIIDDIIILPLIILLLFH